MSRAKPTPTAELAQHVLSERFSDADLVDRVFDYIVKLLPELAEHSTRIKRDVRLEFGGVEQYVRSDKVVQRKCEVMREVRLMFDGRNASQVARVLGISRATVYRCLKQPGGGSD